MARKPLPTGVLATDRPKRPARPVQLNLTGICRADKQPKPPKRLEKVLQAQSLQTLANFGYAAMETGKARAIVQCPCGCGHKFFPTGWQGNTPGFPDVVFFRYSAGFPAVFFPVEMKGEDTAITIEQQRLADNGRTVIAFSIEDAVTAVIAAEEQMDAYRFPEERRQRLLNFLRENEGNLW